MLFHKEKKLCLFLPPKNGTTSSRVFLTSLGWHLLKPWHEFPKFYETKYPNLIEYKKFCFLRDPLVRFLSAVHHTRNVYPHVHNLFYDKIGYPLSKGLREAGFSENLQELSCEEFVDNLDLISGTFLYTFDPQSKWFVDSDVHALDFENFEYELRRITEATNSSLHPVTVENQSWRPEDDPEVTDKVIDFVRKKYAQDYALIKEKLGKSY